MLRLDPAKRLQDAASVIAVIDAILSGRVPVECHITMTKRMTRECGRLLDRYPNAGFVSFVIGIASALAGLAVLSGAI